MQSKKINQLSTDLAPDATDLTIVADPTTGLAKKVTLQQLAFLFGSLVDFYANFAAFPVAGQVNILYCAKDTSKLYLWSGSAYVEVFPSQALLNTYQLRSEIGVSNGYASLDATGKVPVSQLPASLMEYKGMWNASTNTPTLANGTGDTGDVYICNVAGSVNFGAGSISFAVGDYVIYSGSIWQRSSGAMGTVTSVAALTLGTTGTDVSSTVVNGSTTPVITLNIPDASATNRGALSSTDWSTFNSKQSALTNPVTGTGTTNYHTKFTGTSTIGNSLIWDNGTNVGIGNTNTSYTLDVSGSGRYNGNYAGHLLNVQNTNASYYSSTDYYDNAGTEKLIVGYGNASTGNALASKAIIYGTSGVGLNFYTNGSTTAKMVIDTSGNVGIGTSSPTGLGNRALVVTNTSDYPEVIVERLSSGAGKFGMLVGNSGDLLVRNYTAGTNPLLISSGGEIYMGSSTTDKNSRLVVYGSTSDGNTYAFRCFSSGSDILFGVRTDGYINTGTFTSSPYNLVRTGRVMMVDSGGGVGYQSSTRESKTNITNLEDISFVYKLNPVTFNYRKSEGTSNVFTDEYNEDLHYGLIADEVEKVNKDLVFYNEKDGKKELAGVEYGKLTAVLVKAIQEQQAQIQSLQEQINILAK